MLAELFDKVVEQAEEANFPKVIKPEGEPDHVYYLFTAQGVGTRHEAEPKPRNHTAGDITTLVRFVDAYTVSGDETAQAELWFSRSKVVCHIDTDTRRDKVTLPLIPSKQIQLLGALEASPKAMDQKKFLAFLRIDLANAAGAALTNAVRHLKFRSSAEGSSSVTHGKASIGKSLEAQLTGEGTIPEEVYIHVPVFAGYMGQRSFVVSCALEIDADAQLFSLIPFPGETERAIREGEAFVGDTLHGALADAGIGDDRVEVLYGTP